MLSGFNAGSGFMDFNLRPQEDDIDVNDAAANQSSCRFAVLCRDSVSHQTPFKKSGLLLSPHH